MAVISPLRKESSSIYDGFRTLESTNWLTLKKPGCKQWLQAVTSPEISSADFEEACSRTRLAYNFASLTSPEISSAEQGFLIPWMLGMLIMPNGLNNKFYHTQTSSLVAAAVYYISTYSSTSFRILDSTDLRWACPNAYSDFVAAVSLRLVVPGPDQPCTYIPNRNNMDSQWFNVDRILGTHLA